MSSPLRLFVKRALLVISISVFGAAAAFGLLATSTNLLSDSRWWAFGAVMFVCALIAVVVFLEMWQSRNDDLLDELYGVGGKVSGLSKHSRHRRKEMKYYNNTDTRNDK